MPMVQFPVGSEPNPRGRSILFCNGIENDEEDAKKSAEIVSGACRGRIVTVLHNTTTLSQFLGVRTERRSNGNTGIAFDHQEPSRQKKVADAIKEVIREKIREHREQGVPHEEINIFFFVHSHGAVLADLALNTLTQEEKSRVVVFSYGVAKLLEKRIAGVVFNYFNQNDLIASMGHTHTIRKSEDMFAVRGAKEIWEAETEEQALFQMRMKCANEIYQHVFQLPLKDTFPAEARNRYQEIVMEKDPHKRLVSTLKDPYFNERMAYYQSLTTKYTVKLLDGPTKEQGFIALFSHIWGSHSFDSYENQVRQDAAMV